MTKSLEGNQRAHFIPLDTFGCLLALAWESSLVWCRYQYQSRCRTRKAEENDEIQTNTTTVAIFVCYPLYIISFPIFFFFFPFPFFLLFFFDIFSISWNRVDHFFFLLSLLFFAVVVADVDKLKCWNEFLKASMCQDEQKATTTKNV